MILLDTSGLWAAVDGAQPHHAAAAAALRAARPPRLLSPFVLQELDYFLLDRLGVEIELAFLDDVARGAYQLESFDRDDIRAANSIAARHRDLRIGLADASVVVLAERHRCVDVLTTDRRNFSVMLASGRVFRMLPA